MSMQRKNKNTARKRLRSIRTITKMLLLEIAIVLFFVVAWNNSKTTSEYCLKKETIYVEDKDFRYENLLKQNLVITSNSNEYRFPRLNGSMAEYTNHQLYREITVGDKLYITYYTDERIWGSRNYIVDAHTETAALRTIKEFDANHEDRHVVAAIGFALTQVLYLPTCFLYLFLQNGLPKRKRVK